MSHTNEEDQIKYMGMSQQLDEDRETLIRNLDDQSRERREMRGQYLSSSQISYNGKVIKKGKKLKKPQLRDVTINFSNSNGVSIVQSGKKLKPLGMINTFALSNEIVRGNTKLGLYTSEVKIHTSQRGEEILLYMKNDEVKILE